MLALSGATTITISVVGLAALIAILALLRVVFRRDRPEASWRRYRMGVFVERDADAHRPSEFPPDVVVRPRGQGESGQRDEQQAAAEPGVEPLAPE